MSAAPVVPELRGADTALVLLRNSRRYDALGHVRYDGRICLLCTTAPLKIVKGAPVNLIAIP